MEKKVTGLTFAQVQERLKKYGKNVLPQPKPVGDLILLFNQIKSPLIYILLVAALISFLLKNTTDALVILVAVIVNTVLGFYQEHKAQRALFALRQILSPQARVIRQGKSLTIDASELVIGDIVLLTSGDRIPADGEIIEGINLLVNEAVLTGESMPVNKKVKESLFMGTTVVSGRGKMLVCKTGLESEFGKIASQLSQTLEEETPFQKRLSQFASFLAVVVAVLSLFIFLIGIIGGKPLIEMFTTSVALAVAAIPEGMIVSQTAILAIGMQRILKRKALVRRLVAAEALGSVTVIATDKTGTLTEGQMSVVKTQFTNREEALFTAILANNREDPLEIALWEYVQKENLDPQKIQEERVRLSEIPFDPGRKYMAVVIKDTNKPTLYIKGAAEVLLNYSSLPQREKEKWLSLSQKWGEEGLRLIGLGMKKLTDKKSYEIQKEVSSIDFLGLVAIADPVRETVAETLKQMIKCGIKLKVVTGDYQATGKAVLKKLGVPVSGEEILEGEEIEKLSQEGLERKVGKTILFARVTPTQKLRIVAALKTTGEVVALVGDGVNDAPAIKASDIGIVVEGASDVAYETADMVLLDSNFSTIIAAIEEGRGIYANIKKVILYLLSDSFSEIILVFGSILLGIPLPLTAAQILWINIITDGLPNLALTVDPKEKNLLSRPPISPKEELLDFPMKMLIAIISGVTGIFSLILFMILLKFTSNLALSRTIVFTSLAIDSLLYVFSVRTITRPLLRSDFFSNKWLIWAILVSFTIQLLTLYQPFFRSFLDTVPLSLAWWLVVLSGPIIVISLIEFIKIAIIKENS